MRYDTVVGIIPTRIANEDTEINGLTVQKGVRDQI